jgi:hypothetical protein
MVPDFHAVRQPKFQVGLAQLLNEERTTAVSELLGDVTDLKSPLLIRNPLESAQRSRVIYQPYRNTTLNDVPPERVVGVNDTRDDEQCRT